MKSENKKRKHGKPKEILSANMYMIRLAWKGSPLWVFCNMLNNIINPLRNLTIDVLLIGHIYNSIQESQTFEAIKPFLIGLAVFYSVNLAFEAFLHGYVRYIGKTHIRQYIDELICTNAATVPLASYDDPEFYENYIFSVQNCADQAMSAVDNASYFIAYTLGGLFGIGIITDVNPIMLVFVALSIVFSIFLGFRSEKLEFMFQGKKASVQMREEYIHRVFYTKDYAKEVRCLPGLLDLLLRHFEDTENEKIELTRHYGRKRTFYDVLGILNNRGVMYWAVMCAVILAISITGRIEPGNLLIVTLSVGTVSLLVGAVVSTLPQMGKIALFQKKLDAFIRKGTHTEAGQGKKVLSELSEICFDHVSFTYPNEKTPTINDISFIARPGEKLAIVGENGAGKSTILKLILGFYRPSSGRVLVNGIDLNEVDLPSYRRMIGCVFQDINLFSFTVEKNTTFSLEAPDKERLQKALADSGLGTHFSTESELEQNLTREISDDGLILSGGNSQRLAIARALYKNAPMLLLDEITSAIDPETEIDIMQKIERTGESRIVIYISHKLSCIKKSQHIILLENGSIAEEGDHHSLMQLGGKYAAMFQLQSNQFIRETRESILEREDWL